MSSIELKQIELWVGTDDGSPSLVGTGDLVLKVGKDRYTICQNGRLLPGDTAERLIRLLSPEAIACIKTLLNAPASEVPKASDFPFECPSELRIVVKWLWSHGYEVVFGGYAMKQPYVNIRPSENVHKQMADLQNIATTINFDFGRIDLIPPSQAVTNGTWTLNFSPSNDWLTDLRKTFHPKPS